MRVSSRAAVSYSTPGSGRCSRTTSLTSRRLSPTFREALREAGLVEKAVMYLHRAAQHSVARWAMAEAITQYKGFGDSGRVARPILRGEARTRSANGSRGATDGGPRHGSARSRAGLRRARQLCDEVGEAPQLFSVLFGLWWFYELKADLSTALELAKQLLELAGRANEAAQLMQAHRALACTFFWMGEFASAQPHFEQASAHYDTENTARSSSSTAKSPEYCQRALPRTISGFSVPHRALNTMNEALSLASEVATRATGWLLLWIIGLGYTSIGAR